MARVELATIRALAYMREDRDILQILQERYGNGITLAGEIAVSPYRIDPAYEGQRSKSIQLTQVLSEMLEEISDA